MQTISITFKNVIPDQLDSTSLSEAIERLTRQITEMSDRLKVDPKAAHSFIELTHGLNPEVVELPKISLIAEPETAESPLFRMLDKVFKVIRKTDKSVKIIAALATYSGQELSLDQLSEETGFNNSEISSWLAQTGKKVKAINSSNYGKYKLDPDKL